MIIPCQGYPQNSKLVLGTERAWLCNSNAHRLYQGQPRMSRTSGVAVGISVTSERNPRLPCSDAEPCMHTDTGARISAHTMGGIILNELSKHSTSLPSLWNH